MGPGPVEDCDQTDNTVNCYEYKFTIEGPSNQDYTTKGLDHIYWFKPDCCYENDQILMFQGDPEHTCFYVGEGEPTMKFGQGNFQASTCKFTANTSDTEWPFKASTNKTGEISVCLKVKNALECCAIRGPVCGDGSEPRLGETYIEQGGNLNYSILYNEAGDSKDVDCPTCTYKTTLQMEELFLYIGNAPEGRVTWMPFDTPITTHDSPGCVYVRTRSGAVKKVCD